MIFDKSKVYTALNADEVKIGSKGCFSDTIAELKNRVKNEKFYKVDHINKDDVICRFVSSCGLHNALFYLVEEPKEEKYRHLDGTPCGKKI